MPGIPGLSYLATANRGLVARGRAQLDSFVVGLTMPDDTNTGPRVSETSLSNYSGDLINIAAGTKIERKILTGLNRPNAADLELVDCKIIGPTFTPTSQQQALVDLDGLGNSNVKISFCDIQPQNVDWQTCGITGHDFTTLRNNIHESVDAIRVRKLNSGTGDLDLKTFMYGDYLHHLGFYSPSTQPDNITHNDGIQIEGGWNFFAQGLNIYSYMSETRGVANIDGSYDSANKRANGDGNPWYPSKQVLSSFITTPNVSTVGNFTLDSCWIFGGYAKFNIANNTYGCQGGKITNCRMAPDAIDTRPYMDNGNNFRVNPYTGAALGLVTRTGNTWIDNGNPCNNNGEGR